jgi:hypothetical protein
MLYGFAGFLVFARQMGKGARWPSFSLLRESYTAKIGNEWQAFSSQFNKL